MKYSVVYGNLFRCYTGTNACTGFTVVPVKTKKEARQTVNHILKTKSDLVIVINLETGKEVEL